MISSSPTHPSIFLISSSQLGSSQPIQDRWTATAAAAEMPSLHAGSPPTRLATRGATTVPGGRIRRSRCAAEPCAPPCGPLVWRGQQGQTVDGGLGRRSYLVRCPASKWLVSRPCRAPANVSTMGSIGYSILSTSSTPARVQGRRRPAGDSNPMEAEEAGGGGGRRTLDPWPRPC